MGGSNEKTLQMPTRSGQGSREIKLDRQIRVHENSGEVHFHDDTQKIKVAIPSAEFWREWEKFQSGRISKSGESLHLVDHLRGTVAIITSKSNQIADKLNIDVDVSLMKADVSPAVVSLRDFASGK